jgi:soluble lytic murein transglycosylase
MESLCRRLTRLTGLAYLEGVSIFARQALLGGLITLFSLGSAASDPVPLARPTSAPAHGSRTAEVPARGADFLVLKSGDVINYRNIFDLQRVGEWNAADRAIRRLDNRLLLGHVTFQRLMHPTKYRSHYDELYRWLSAYSDHPSAYRVYALARMRQPDGSTVPVLPVYGKEHLRQFLGESPAPVLTASDVERELSAPIVDLINSGDLSSAERAIGRSPLGAVPSDRLRAKVAFEHLLRGNNKYAFKLAAWASERSRDGTSLPDWVAGLAAYKLGDYRTARRHFGLHARSKHAGDWNAAAGAFWAARSSLRLGARTEARSWWRAAATHRYTFYGQLARATLGLPPEKSWYGQKPTVRDIAVIRTLKGGVRALALTQIGQYRRADEELVQYLGDSDRALTASITRVAEYLKLPQAAVLGAFRLSSGFGVEAPPSALYPRPAWEPSDGLLVDQALVWAFVRQESLFNPRATSSSGARGLMQLMPSTANYVAGEDRYIGANRDELYEPPTNLSLGQRYLRYLMRRDQVGSNLFRLAVAYNAGIGNLTRWDRNGQLSKDPLMFIETLPLLETRLFVERVLANLWLYRQQLGQPTPSLSDLTAGKWPLYVPLDGRGIEVATDTDDGNR